MQWNQRAEMRRDIEMQAAADGGWEGVDRGVWHCSTPRVSYQNIIKGEQQTLKWEDRCRRREHKGY